jgi:hypothetical protein
MTKIDPTQFTWSRWRAGSPVDFLVECRSAALVGARGFLRDHTVGYCDAEQLTCRPKIGHKAVMFWKDGRHFWFHLTNREFHLIYNEE